MNSTHEENNSNYRSEAKETNIKDGKTNEISDEGKNILREIHDYSSNIGAGQDDAIVDSKAQQKNSVAILSIAAMRG